jgi:hypothetical protein
MCLIQDKRELVRANEQLARENAQLQELLGYFSSGMATDGAEFSEGEAAEA